MTTWIIIIVALNYVAGFLVMLMLQLSSGPVTPTLALARAFVWPWYILTGHPKGVRSPMD
jgi:threonine/homoserine efflux transporter RhtA